MFTRRDILRVGASAAVGAGLIPRRVWSHSSRPKETLSIDTPARDPAVRALAAKALDVARQSGASYADIRITMQLSRDFPNTYTDVVTHAAGIRTMVNGYWGFASTPFLGEAEIVRIARDATALAQGIARRGTPREAALAPASVVRDGDWIEAVEIDPTAVEIEEVLSWLGGVAEAGERVLKKNHGKKFKLSLDQGGVSLGRTDVVCASTEGAYAVQTVYKTDIYGPGFRVQMPDGKDGSGVLVDEEYFLNDQLTDRLPATRGWERAVKRPVDAMMELCVNQLERDLALPIKPAEVGRYDFVCDWSVMGSLLHSTLGTATQLDRAIGDEANAAGTSYLGPNPLDFLGTSVAAPRITIQGERSSVGARGTSRWDAEGVPTQPFTLVKDGTLVDYQTTRESAAWLAAQVNAADSRSRVTSSAQSHGCSGSPTDTALDIPIQYPPNLLLAAGTDNTTFDTLISGMARGFVLRNGGVGQVDQQAANGFMSGHVYEVERGKIVARTVNCGILFRSSEIWKNITAIGGRSTGRWSDGRITKGEPAQSTRCSVSAPPAYIKDLTVIDVTRRV